MIVLCNEEEVELDLELMRSHFRYFSSSVESVPIPGNVMRTIQLLLVEEVECDQEVIDAIDFLQPLDQAVIESKIDRGRDAARTVLKVGVIAALALIFIYLLIVIVVLATT